MNQTESIKAYLEEKASKHKIAYTDIPKYQELIEGYLVYKERSCTNCKFVDRQAFCEPCNTCCLYINKPNFEKA